MTDRSRGEKNFLQDATGILFILVGAFFALSVILFLNGQEPSEGFEAFTWPVVELVARIGSPAALVFSAGLAAVGAVLFTRRTPVALTRPLATLVLSSLGVTLIFGAFGLGGELGAWLPSLAAGFVGRALAVIVGAALSWLGWSLLFPQPQARASAADVVQRVGLSARADAAAGVSSAEAALLGGEPKSAPRSSARRDEPVSQEVVRPYAPSRAEPRPVPATRTEPSRAPSVSKQSTPEPLLAASVSTLTPPAPAWETTDEIEGAEEPQAELVAELHPHAPAHAPEVVAEAPTTVATVPAVLEPPPAMESEAEAEEDELEDFVDEAEAFAAEDEAAEDEAEADEPAEALEDSASVSRPPAASWEQVGLFDEVEEEVAEDEAEAPSAPAELTPAFDFEAGLPKKPSHEPEADDPFARLVASSAKQETRPASPRPIEIAPADVEDEDPAADEPAAVSKPFTLQPVVAAAKPAPVVTRDGEEERWQELVYEAG